MKKSTGALPSKIDNRDYNVTKRFFSRFLKPVDWRIFMPCDIKDQNGEGMCVGYATATVAETIWNYKYKKSINFSEREIYEKAKEHDEWGGSNYEGTSLRGAMKALYKIGICQEKYWKTKPLVNCKPSFTWIKDAGLHRSSHYFNFKGKDGNIDFSRIYSKLKYQPLVGVFYVPKNFEYLHETGKISELKELSLTEDLHAMSIMGEIHSGEIIIVNSWSDEWGKQGCCYLPKNIFELCLYECMGFYL